MAPPLLLLQDIGLTFGGTPLLTGVQLSVGPGERLCLVGRNGSGKSTLLKIAAGMVEPDAGSRFLQPSVTIRYLPQEPDLQGFATTGAFVEAGLAPGDDAHRARYLLETLGLTGAEDPARLSGGESRRAALARTLAPDPDILLLDEPTNHLDVAAIEGLEEALASMRSALVLVSHDRRFLETLSRATVWLDRGTTRRLEQGFAAFEAWRDKILEEEEIERHKLDRKIAMEEHWVCYGVTARRKRNERRMRTLQELRTARQRARANRPVGDVALAAQEAQLSGKLVIEADGVAKSYGDRPIVRGLTLRVERGDRIGIVGPNGAGKTTLLNLLTGVIPPDAGTVRLGTNIAAATLDQRRDSLDPEATVAETLTGGRGETVSINGETRHVVGYLRDFLFRPEQARSPVTSLSGGERGRLMLARSLARPSNLLVLDEPTNDLDLETLDLLQEMLADYPGTLLIVSHDRDFLDRVATSVIAFEGNAKWVEYAGGYSDMVAQRGYGVGALQAPSAKPKAAPKPAAAAAPKSRRRLTFADQHALKTSPARIEALSAEIRRLEAALSDPEFYRRDPAVFTATGRALEAARAELAATEEEWLRLELLREELEGG
ncbi:MAG TPA: ABC-F family ATP-binding cassette domain-containing protein [Candidatus Acidoferrum sp.]|nr:ABC-F family ATP-binding cassette domain-containing protein [Candidatus Acidoferrum sp.]